MRFLSCPDSDTAPDSVLHLISDEVDAEVNHLHGNAELDSDDGGRGSPAGEAPAMIDSSQTLSEEDSELVRKWKNVMGPNYEIKVRKNLCF